MRCDVCTRDAALIPWRVPYGPGVPHGPGVQAKYNVHYDGGGTDPRKLTAILYLNEGWRADDDGRLMMYDAGGFSPSHGPGAKCWRTVAPLAGRLVLFRSDFVLHKVAWPDLTWLGLAGLGLTWLGLAGLG
jgi:hypothetical protein